MRDRHARPEPSTPIRTEIELHRPCKYMEIAFGDGRRCNLPNDYLRAFSPSAAHLGRGRGRCPGQEVPQVGKKHVDINGIEPGGPIRRPPVLLRRA